MEKGKQTARPATKKSSSFKANIMLLGVFLSLLVIILSLLFEELPFKTFYLVAFILFLISYNSETSKDESQNRAENKPAEEKPER